ncbi:MAG TPA: hypothetical protein DD421_04995 [Clostridiaceae bacterium]|nr:hypothetical protein [Clostridiaceae bacterium]
MNIKCMLDNKQYTVKPIGKEIGSITNRLIKSSIEIDIKDLAESLTRGQTFKPSFLNGKKETDWISQQLFALDFDENTTIEEELNRCKELNILPVFGYTSFSHTPEHHKFRLVFCTDEAITDYNIAKQLQLSLMSVFNNCDEKCKNLSRLYFGGKSLIYKNYDNRINCNEILEKYPIENPLKVSDTNAQENKPYNNKGINNISILLYGEKPPTDINNDNYNLKALKNRDVEYLKKSIGNPRIILENNQAFFDYIKGYDLGKLLEIKYPTSFRCILHEDNNPSAGIFKNEEGTYIYHCFSCNVSYNIINLIEVLGNFKSRPKAYKFIREIFNLEIMETEWQKEQKEMLRENHKMLLNGELEKQCPEAFKNIKRNIKYLDQLFLIAEDNVYSKKFTDSDDNVVFYASTRFICKLLGINEHSAIEISKKNVLFQYHNLLNKIDETNIPEDMLKRSQAININSDNKAQKHINYYSIPSYTTNMFQFIEEQGQKWKDNNYTMKGLSREMFYRAEGKEVADKLYPQYKQVYDHKEKKIVDRTTTIKSDTQSMAITKILLNILDNKSYATEKEVINELIINSNIKQREVERQLKKSLQEILLSYDLKRVRCNKEIKKKYNVIDNGYPFIIVKNN